MAISEFEEKRCERELEKFLESKPSPAHIRDELDISYRLENQSVEIFEIRPLWNNPAEKIETPIAKATFVKSCKIWRIYWQRADLKWHRYDPVPQVKQLEDFLAVIAQDEYACFWG